MRKPIRCNLAAANTSLLTAGRNALIFRVYDPARKHARYAAIILHLLICVTHSVAQPHADSVNVILEAIEVSAFRARIEESNAPLSLSSRDLTSDQVISAPTSLSDVLAFLPGLYMADRENMALGERLSVRGMGWRSAFGVRGVHVLLDGIPLTMPDGQTALDIVEPAHLARAELIRGPASAIWGNSSGGVLALSSRSDPSVPELTVGTALGSFGLRRIDLSSSHRKQHQVVQFYASHFERDGFRQYSRATRTRAGLHLSQTISGRSSLALSAAFIHSPTTQHPGGLTRKQAIDEPTQANETNVAQKANENGLQGQAGLQYRQWSGRSLLTVGAYGIYRRLDNTLPFAIIPLHRRVGGLRTTWERRVGDFVLLAGTDIGRQRDVRKNYDNLEGERSGSPFLDQVERVRNRSVFTRATMSRDRLVISGALRLDDLRFDAEDHIRDDGDQSGARSFLALSPSIGISFTSRLGTPFVNLATSFESPTTTELVNRPGGGGGFNQELDPQRSVGLEVGVRNLLQDSRYSADITLYTMRVRGLLSPFQTETGGDRTFYRNSGVTHHSGLEANVSLELHEGIRAEAVYTWSHLKFGDGSLDGNRLPGIPAHRALAGLVVDRAGLNIRVDIETASDMSANDVNSEGVKGYVLVHTALGYPLLRISDSVLLSPFIEIRNLTDELYVGSVIVNARGGRYYEPAAGQSWRAGIRVRFH